MVVAFEGWNDAADAASYALTNLARAWQAVPFAEIDPEEFFDFTEARPELTVVEGLVREITWPTTVFSVAPGPVDIVVARGPEPQLRWRRLLRRLRRARAGAPGRQGRHPRRLSRRGRGLAARPARRHRQRCRVAGPAGHGPLALRGADRHRRRARRGARRGRRPDGHDLGERALLLDPGLGQGRAGARRGDDPVGRPARRPRRAHPGGAGVRAPDGRARGGGREAIRSVQRRGFHIAGNIYAGLYYPITIAAITLLFGTFFLKETHGTRIWDEYASMRPR